MIIVHLNHCPCVSYQCLCAETIYYILRLSHASCGPTGNSATKKETLIKSQLELRYRGGCARYMHFGIGSVGQCYRIV
jgi:hypothetical protein